MITQRFLGSVEPQTMQHPPLLPRLLGGRGHGNECTRLLALLFRCTKGAKLRKCNEVCADCDSFALPWQT